MRDFGLTDCALHTLDISVRRKLRTRARDVDAKLIPFFESERMVGEAEFDAAHRAGSVVAAVCGEGRYVVAQKIPSPIGFLDANTNVETRVLAVALDR